MSPSAALQEVYRELVEIDRRREGVRYSATLEDGTPVVALVIAPDVADRIESVDNFIAAFERAAAIHHEAIVPAVAWGRVSDGTLHCSFARLEVQRVEPGSTPPVDVARIGLELAGGLMAIHGTGLVHGAISTARIVTSPHRGAQLGDLGLFSALSEGGLGAQRTIALLSDQGYPSPETLKGKEPDALSDVYSLGASLYELLTGKPPYGGRTTSYVLAAVLSEDAGEGQAGGRGADASSAVVDAVMRAIEQAPEDRWPTAAAFAAALASSAPVADAAAKDGVSRRRGCLAGAAAVVMAVAGFLAAN